MCVKWNCACEYILWLTFKFSDFLFDNKEQDKTQEKKLDSTISPIFSSCLGLFMLTNIVSMPLFHLWDQCINTTPCSDQECYEFYLLEINALWCQKCKSKNTSKGSFEDTGGNGDKKVCSHSKTRILSTKPERLLSKKKSLIQNSHKRPEYLMKRTKPQKN